MNAQERHEKSLAVQRREPPDSKMFSPFVPKVKRPEVDSGPAVFKKLRQ